MAQLVSGSGSQRSKWGPLGGGNWVLGQGGPLQNWEWADLRRKLWMNIYVLFCVSSIARTRNGLTLSHAVCGNPTCLQSCGQIMTKSHFFYLMRPGSLTCQVGSYQLFRWRNVLPEAVRAKYGILALEATSCCFLKSERWMTSDQACHGEIQRALYHNCWTPCTSDPHHPPNLIKHNPLQMSCWKQSSVSCNRMKHPRMVQPWTRSPAYQVTLLQKGLRLHTPHERG